MNIVVVLLLLNIWPLHFAIASSLTITLLLLNFQLFTIEHIIIWQFNDATIIVFGNFLTTSWVLKMILLYTFLDALH
jgi:hypothetical protein